MSALPASSYRAQSWFQRTGKSSSDRMVERAEIFEWKRVVAAVGAVFVCCGVVFLRWSSLARIPSPEGWAGIQTRRFAGGGVRR